MKNIPLFLLIFLTFQIYGQDSTKKGLDELSYENIIAKKACICLSETDSTSTPQQAVIKCIIKAKNKVHEEDFEKKYKRDYTVEGIRGLNKKVTNLLSKNCDIVSKTN